MPVPLVLAVVLLGLGGGQSARAQDNTAPSNLNLVQPNVQEDRSIDPSKNSTLSVTYSYDEANSDRMRITLEDADDIGNSATFEIDDSGYSGGNKTVDLMLDAPDNSEGQGLGTEGTYNVRIRAIDESGNSASITVTDRLVIDGTSPTVSNVALGNDGNGNVTLSLTVAAQAGNPGQSDPLGTKGSDLSVSVDGPSAGVDHYVFDRSDFTESGSGPYTYELSKTQAFDDGDGDYTAKVDAARDEAGNDGADPTQDQATYTAASPTATTDNYSTPEDQSLSVSADGLLGNDSSTDLTVALAETPTNGTVSSLNDDGSFTYEPAENFNGTDSFVYEVTDPSTGFTDEATVSLTVSSVNDAPTAADDSYSAQEDQGREVTDVSEGVLANDADVDAGDAAPEDLSVASVEGNSVSTSGATTVILDNGSLDVWSDGTFDYNPDQNYNGTETFQYTVADDAGATSAESATVTLDVGATNDPPTIGDIADNQETQEDTPLDITFSASDVETALGPSNFSVTSDNQDLVRSGDVSFAGPDGNGDFTATITPRPDSNGTATLEIVVTDDGGATNRESFDLTVTAVNDAPQVVTNQELTLDEDGQASVGGLLETTDVEDGPSDLEYTVTSLPSNGDLLVDGTALSSNGTFTQQQVDGDLVEYRHDGSETTADAFDFSVADGGGGGASVTGTFTVSVTPVNDPPTVSIPNPPSSIDEDTDGSVTFTASDPETDISTANFSASSSNQSLVQGGDVTFSALQAEDEFSATIPPRTNENGTTTIEIAVNDGDGETATASFSLTVEAVNDAPTASDDTYQPQEDADPFVPSTGLLANDSDLENDDLSVQSVTVDGSATSIGSNTSVSLPNGSLTLSSDGSFSYEPDANFDGEESFTYTVTDGDKTDQASVTLNVQAVNDAPTVSLSSSSATIQEDGTLSSFGFTIGDVESAAADLTVSVSSGNEGLVPSGNLSTSGSGTDRTLSATPAPDANDDNESGPATITVTVSDGEKQSSADFTLSVTPVNDPPEIAGDQGFTVDEGGAYTLGTDDLDAIDPDDSGSGLTYTVITSPSNGTIEVGGDPSVSDFTQQALADGTVAYVHGGGEADSDNFEVSLDDGDEDGSAPATASVSVTVAPQNDPPTISTIEDPAIDEDSTLSLDVTIGDAETSPSNLTLSASADNPDLVPEDSLRLGGSGPDRTLTAVPIADSNGTVAIELTVEDTGDESSGATTTTEAFTLTVRAVNDAPVLTTNRPLPIQQGARLAIRPSDLSATDVDDPDETLAFVIEEAPTQGTLRDTSETPGTLVAGDRFTQQDVREGRIEYEHTSESLTNDRFVFSLRDGRPGAEGPTDVTFEIVVTGENTPPTARNDTFSVEEDQTLRITEAENGVLANDDDPEGGTLRAALVNPPPTGEGALLQLSGDRRIGERGTFVFEPAEDFAGTTQFTYEALDRNGGTAEATATIVVTPVNDAPRVTTNEQLSLEEGGQAPLDGVLETTDVEDGPGNLQYTVMALPANGTLVVDGTALSSNGTFTQQQVNDGLVAYRHDGSETTSDAFSFTVADNGGDGLSVDGTFEVSVTPVNDAPTISLPASPSPIAEDTDGSVTFTAADVESDLGPSHFSASSKNENLVRSSDISFRSLPDDQTYSVAFAPRPDSNGTATIEITVDDGEGKTASGTFSLTVTAVNDTPRVATNAGLAVDQQSSATIEPSVLRATDVDDPPSALTFTVPAGGGPSQGRLLVDGAEASTFTQQQIAEGLVTYEHTADALDDDQIAFRVADDDGAARTGRTLAVTVQDVNFDPTARDDRYVAQEGQTLSIAAPENGVLYNDSDPDGDDLGATVVTAPSSGTLDLDPDAGTFEYTPNSGVSGQDFFEYEATDGNGGTDEARVTIRVRPAETGLAASRSFPDPTQQQSFRLVALPGAATPDLASTLSGRRGDDWRAFREVGATDTSAYARARCGDGTSCTFGPGTGYWLIAREAWSVQDSIQTVTLEAGSTATDRRFRIPLHDGWNVISNPLERDVDWGAVQAASGTEQALYRWDGRWRSTNTFASATTGEAFYFRDDQIDTLTVPYPGLRSTSLARSASAGGPSTLTLHAVQDGDTLSTVRAWRRAGATAGLDSTDIYGPPGYFGPASLRLMVREEERAHALRTEHRPREGGGAAFDVRLRAAPDSALTLVARGLGAVSADEVVLMRRSTGRPHDMKSDPSIPFIPSSKTTHFRLLMGSEAFVEAEQRKVTSGQVQFLPNYPNPFRRATTLEYTLPERQEVRLVIYDVLGRRVQVLADGPRAAGFHRLQWQGEGQDGRPVASGVYFARLVTDSTTETRRLVVVR